MKRYYSYNPVKGLEYLNDACISYTLNTLEGMETSTIDAYLMFKNFLHLLDTAKELKELDYDTIYLNLSPSFFKDTETDETLDQKTIICYRPIFVKDNKELKLPKDIDDFLFKNFRKEENIIFTNYDDLVLSLELNNYHIDEESNTFKKIEKRDDPSLKFYKIDKVLNKTYQNK